MKQDLCALLRGNSYPGRGILLGRSADGKSAVIAYFITQRLSASVRASGASRPTAMGSPAKEGRGLPSPW